MKTILLLFLALFSTYALGDTLKVTDGSVTWTAKGKPKIMSIDGKGGKPTGSITVEDGKASGSFDCDLTAFTTGMSLRDTHMKEKYLEVAKFPAAKLVLDPVAFTAGKEVDWTGSLTLKGVTKPVKGKATINAADADATFTVNLDDYPVGVPSFEGITVASNVEVKVQVKAGK